MLENHTVTQDLSRRKLPSAKQAEHLLCLAAPLSLNRSNMIQTLDPACRLKKQARWHRPGRGGKRSPKDMILTPSFQTQWMRKEFTSRSDMYYEWFLVDNFECVCSCPRAPHPVAVALWRPDIHQMRVVVTSLSHSPVFLSERWN